MNSQRMLNHEKQKVKHIVVDVRSPRDRHRPNIKKRPAAGFFSRGGFLPKGTPTPKSRRSFKMLNRVVASCIGTIVFLVMAYSVYLWSYSDDALKSMNLIYENFRSVASDISELNTASVGNSLLNISSELNGLKNRAAPLSIAPYLKNIPGALTDAKDITETLRSINASVDDLKRNGFGAIFSGEGEKMLSLLKKADADLIELQRLIARFNGHITPLSGILGGNSDYVKMTTELMSYREGLESFIALLEKPTDTHLLVLFQNPSEIRPAGGFTGSYADLVLSGGAVKEINVNDIYYPEHFLKEKIVPPFQLQGITTHWGPQDANWFFNFPSSAKKVTEIMEKSAVYAEKDIKFDGVIAINIRLVEDFLKLTGAIEVPSYGHTLNSGNFLRVVQEEVEEGRDKIPGQNPKRILNVITPILMQKLTTLDETRKSEIANIFKYRFSNKDIQFYFEESKLQNLMFQLGGAGEVFEIPGNFTGDYLAVVNANIAGGKTDMVILQNIELNSIIHDDGTVSNILVVERMHNGDKEKEPRYRAFNQNFIKIFTLPGAKLIGLKGNSEKIISPHVNYKSAGYAVDTDLALIESTKSFLKNFNASTYQEAGKNVFATWFSVAAGDEKKLSTVYENAIKVVVAHGQKYEFVLDKQSGTESDFKYTIKAPAGFIWRESNSQTFSYETASLPARVKLELTLLRSPSFEGQALDKASSVQ